MDIRILKILKNSDVTIKQLLAIDNIIQTNENWEVEKAVEYEQGRR